MDRGNLIPIVVALVCIVSMGMAASTLLSAQVIGGDGEPTPIDTTRPMDQIGQDNPQDPDDFEGDPAEIDEGSGISGMTTCVPMLDTSSALLGVLAGFFAFVYLVYHRFNIAIGMLTGWTVFPPIMLVYFILTDCTSRGDEGLGTIGGAGAVPLENAGSQLVPISDIPVWVIPLLVGTVVLGTAFVLYRSADTDEIVIPEDGDEEDDPDLDSFARAAGRAADRIEEHNVDADNAVYQAWVEMTELLNIENPETYTAGEFADAATRLGMASSDVSELTTLFNEVRYGGKDAETREGQAINVLRDIESQYREETVTETETADDNRTVTDDTTNEDDTQ